MMATARRSGPLALAMAMVAGALGLVAARLCQLALADGSRLSEIGRRQHRQTEELAPVRGAILDRAGEPLAISIGADSIFLRPDEVPNDERGAAVARTLGLSTGQWLRKLSSSSPFVWLKRHATPRELEGLRALALPGIGTVPERRRLYPQGLVAGPVVGFAGVDSQGLEGIELAYDGYLRGSIRAVGFERDAFGRRIYGPGVNDEPRQGAEVQLTLDLALQYVAERELSRQVKETRAAKGLVLALDPQSGELLALAQYPSADPNHLERSRPDDRRNRAVTDAFEPGSTMKGVLVAAALDAGVARRDDPIFCERGVYAVGRRRIHDHHPHDVLTVAEVVRQSSNIGAVKIGERLGAERYANYLKAFGFGGRTGIDLAGEQPGILRAVETWKTIDLATASFGHGVAVTPLQMAVAYATIANGGYRMRPFVVRRVLGEGGEVLRENRPTVVRRVVSEETAREVTEILEGVVGSEGTAEKATIGGLRIAGKTGTAQKVDLENGGYTGGRIASFVGYMPAERPTLLILVILDEPKSAVYGGVVAAPLFREIALAAVELALVAPGGVADPVGGGAGPAAAKAPGPLEETTRFVGLSLREALRKARSFGLAVEIAGSGYVVGQTPAPGFFPETVAVLRLELAGEPKDGDT